MLTFNYSDFSIEFPLQNNYSQDQKEKIIALFTDYFKDQTFSEDSCSACDSLFIKKVFNCKKYISAASPMLNKIKAFFGAYSTKGSEKTETTFEKADSNDEEETLDQKNHQETFEETWEGEVENGTQKNEGNEEGGASQKNEGNEEQQADNGKQDQQTEEMKAGETSDERNFKRKLKKQKILSNLINCLWNIFDFLGDALLFAGLFFYKITGASFKLYLIYIVAFATFKLIYLLSRKKTRLPIPLTLLPALVMIAIFIPKDFVVFISLFAFVHIAFLFGCQHKIPFTITRTVLFIVVVLAMYTESILLYADSESILLNNINGIAEHFALFIKSVHETLKYLAEMFKTLFLTSRI